MLPWEVEYALAHRPGAGQYFRWLVAWQAAVQQYKPPPDKAPRAR